ncbi:hypothetical protein [Mycetocola saprophilus]|uniref:hypothetical protein n=1 Tax=Mycetocola saprophilus TaxID=76636 RepID=UPI0004C010EB|nr:hypothetical protein [Mycetocola saprophilus]
MPEVEVPAWLAPIVIAAIAASGAWAGAWLNSRGGRRNTDHTRITTLEARVDALSRRNTILWNYNRALIDHIYRGSPPPPPPIPEGAL